MAISFIFIVFFSACSERPKNELELFKALDESLLNSNKTINRSTETLLMLLQEKAEAPSSSYRAKLWLPKAILTQKLSTDVILNIEVFRSSLKKEPVRKIKGEELYDRLLSYQESVFAIDSQMTNVFKTIEIIKTPKINSSDGVRENMEALFKNIPVEAAMAILSQFQNNVRNLENRMIGFCNSKVYSEVWFDFYSTIIGQSCNYVRGGTNMEIYAGVGAFSKSVNPSISIYNKSITVGYDGVAVYKFKASNRAGKHFIPVKISYTDQDGKQQIVEKVVEYTVMKEPDQNN